LHRRSRLQWDPYKFEFLALAADAEEHALQKGLLEHIQQCIGIILCKGKNRVIAEYALRDLAKPVGVSSYVTKLVESLPASLRGSLPSPKELEADLKKDASGKD
jgi:hypothetical protein